MFYKTPLLFTYVIAFVGLNQVRNVLSSGALSLDEFTFEKILAKFPATLVQFDVAFPYGEKYDIYTKLAQDTSNVQDLLVATVGVKDYGERENEKLAERYGADKESFPVLKLFRNGDTENPVSFPDHLQFTLDNLKRFIRENTDIYIGLIGCLQTFDKFASEFMAGNDLTVRKKILESAGKETVDLDGEKNRSANYYIKIMEKVLENGDDFIPKEIARLQKILQTKLSTNKKSEVEHKLNIVRSFVVQVQKLKAKSEL